MYAALGGTLEDPTDGVLSLSYREHEAWSRYMDGKSLTLLIGDETAGPFITFTWFAPMDEMMPLTIAHSHDSDNWRLSVQGTTNMGKETFLEGQFRFHDGGVPYASDNLTWGPDGGYGIVMFADRRGWPVRPVKKELYDQIVPGQVEFSKANGIDIQSPCPGAPAIRTTIGPLERSHLNSGFDAASDWPEVVPGIRRAAALMGDRAAGPVLLLQRCDAGTQAVPTCTIDTETVHVIAAGSCAINGSTKAHGDFWLAEAGAQPAVEAGPDGLSLVTIIGDRRAVAGLVATGDSGAQTWAADLAQVTAGLSSELVTTPA